MSGWSLPAAAGAALLVALLVSIAPRLGGIVLAIIVFQMLRAGIERGSI